MFYWSKTNQESESPLSDQCSLLSPEFSQMIFLCSS